MRGHGVLLAVSLLLAGGCSALRPQRPMPTTDAVPSSVVRLDAGDDVQVEFFGAPDLNTRQRVRADGKLSFKLVGDVQAAGLTPEELRRSLIALFESELQAKSVTVTLMSGMPFFVSGAVVAPGRYEYANPTTALQAIMAAGGFDHEWADVSRVVVIRNKHDKRVASVLDFRAALAGKDGTPFYLRPNDMVYVPPKRLW